MLHSYEGNVLRGDSATGIEQPCSMGLLGGPNQGMSSTPDERLTTYDSSRKIRNKPGEGCSSVFRRRGRRVVRPEP